MCVFVYKWQRPVNSFFDSYQYYVGGNSQNHNGNTINSNEFQSILSPQSPKHVPKSQGRVISEKKKTAPPGSLDTVVRVCVFQQNPKSQITKKVSPHL